MVLVWFLVLLYENYKVSLDVFIEVAGGRRWTAMIVDNQDTSSLVVFNKPFHSVDILKTSKAHLGARIFVSLKKCYEKFSSAAETLAGVSISFV